MIPIALDTGAGRMASESSSRGAFQRAGDYIDDLGADGADMLLPGTPPASTTERLGEGGTFAGRPFETFGRAVDTINPFTSGGFGSGGGSGGGGGSTPVTNNVDADVRPRFTINVDTDSLVDEVERLVEDAQDEVRDELLDKIEGVERDIDDLERGLTRGR